jgi:hypothetical protein
MQNLDTTISTHILPNGTAETTIRATDDQGNLVTTVRTLTLSEDEANPTPISATGDAVGTYEETVTVTDPDTGKVISETTTTVTGNTTADGTIWSTTSEVTEGRQRSRDRPLRRGCHRPARGRERCGRLRKQHDRPHGSRRDDRQRRHDHRRRYALHAEHRQGLHLHRYG